MFFCCSKQKNNLNSNTEFDSITYYLNLTNADNISKKNKLDVLNKAYRLIELLNNSEEKRNSLSKISFKYHSLNDLKKLNEISSKLVVDAKEAKDSTNLAVAYRGKSALFKSQQQYDSAYYYYIKTEKIYAKRNEEENLAKTRLNKGITQLWMADYYGADSSLLQAHSYYKKKNDNDNIIICLNQLGLVANKVNEYERALIYFNSALKTINETDVENKEHLRSICYNNIGLVYINKKDYLNAKKYFELGLNNSNIEKEDPELYSTIINYLGFTKLKLKDYTQLPNLFFESQKINDSLGLSARNIVTDINLSEYYAATKDSAKSLQFANKAYNVSKEKGFASYKLLAMQQLALVDKKNSTKYSNQYVEESDSLKIAEGKSKNRFARIELETDEIIVERDKVSEENKMILYSSIVVLGVFLIFFYIRNQKNKERENLLKQKQQEATQEIYRLIILQQNKFNEGKTSEKNKISKEIHDGVLGRLFGLRLNLDGLNSHNDPASIEKRMDYLNELKIIEQDLREISHELSREKHIIINNFVIILNNLLETQSTTNKTKLIVEMDEKIEWEKISSVIKINIYRIIQECFQNINKYANAETIILEILKNDKNEIILSILDDGIGFETEKKIKGIGIKNIISRVKEMKGKLEIKSKLGKGTQIEIRIPIKYSVLKEEE